ncbi:MAG: hypothetical protein NTY19_14640, partial [Planctomycetota bacterium]|nr:hypothetical protein [Planctomycetota bacterium]
AVAHEIGHGFHEALNHNSVAVLPFPVRWPEDGEAVGEALRYFVERRLGSPWQPAQDKQTLEFCGYGFDAFRTLVQSLAKAR